MHSIFRMMVAHGAVAIRDESICVALYIKCTKAQPHVGMVDGAFTHTMVI